LPNKDKGSKSDPFLVLFSIDGAEKQIIGTTEIVVDNLNPKWIKKIEVEYLFESQ
jgi:hypothetical protein